MAQDVLQKFNNAVLAAKQFSGDLCQTKFDEENEREIRKQKPWVNII